MLSLLQQARTEDSAAVFDEISISCPENPTQTAKAVTATSLPNPGMRSAARQNEQCSVGHRLVSKSGRAGPVGSASQEPLDV